VHAEPAQLDKESLVARLTGQLRKLKKEELVSLVERSEAGTLDFRHLTTSGEGGFGFQEELAGEERERSDRGERRDGDEQREGEGGGALAKAKEAVVDEGAGALAKAKDAVGSMLGRGDETSE
jgi:hypothetical protein